MAEDGGNFVYILAFFSYFVFTVCRFRRNGGRFLCFGRRRSSGTSNNNGSWENGGIDIPQINGTGTGSSDRKRIKYESDPEKRRAFIMKMILVEKAASFENDDKLEIVEKNTDNDKDNDKRMTQIKEEEVQEQTLSNDNNNNNNDIHQNENDNDVDIDIDDIEQQRRQVQQTQPEQEEQEQEQSHDPQQEQLEIPSSSPINPENTHQEEDDTNNVNTESHDTSHDISQMNSNSHGDNNSNSNSNSNNNNDHSDEEDQRGNQNHNDENPNTAIATSEQNEQRNNDVFLENGDIDMENCITEEKPNVLQSICDAFKSISPKSCVDDADTNADADSDHIDSNPNTDSDVENETDSDKLCPICLGEFEKEDDICKSKNEECPHFFHLECMMEWLMHHDECPMCRTDFLKDSGKEVTKENEDIGIRLSSSEDDTSVYTAGIMLFDQQIHRPGFQN